MRPCLYLEPVTYPAVFAASAARFSIPSSSKSPQSVVFDSSKDLSCKFRRFSTCCSNPDGSISLHEKTADGGDEEEEFGNRHGDSDILMDSEEESVSDDGVYIEITRTGKNSRRIVARIGIDATLETIWGILTDYERLADFIPGLAVSELMEKRDNFARLYQIGEQDLAFGLKFNAKGVVDCYEKELEDLPGGQKRDIEFKMIDGDFQLFEGKWSIEQLHEGFEDSNVTQDRDFQTTLMYVVDVKPKLFLPVQLVQGRLLKEITTNLRCIREEANKTITLPAS